MADLDGVTQGALPSGPKGLLYLADDIGTVRNWYTAMNRLTERTSFLELARMPQAGVPVIGIVRSVKIGELS